MDQFSIKRTLLEEGQTETGKNQLPEMGHMLGFLASL